MNNPPLRDNPSEARSSLINLFFLMFGSLSAILIFTVSTFAQTAVWRYVATLTGGVKSYLNDEVKTLPNKNKAQWEKMMKSDGSSATALIERNCPDKLRLVRQITSYNSN